MIPFVGRSKELKELEYLFDQAFNYHGSFALIRGEPGVGKTRLLEEFANTRDKEMSWVLKGRSLPSDARSFSPFLQMIEAQLEVVEYKPQLLIRFIDTDAFASLCRFLPHLKSHYPIEVPAVESEYGEKGLVFDAIYRFFSNLARFKPLGLVLDDILWMDTDSLETLKYLVDRIADKPILVVCASRPWEKHSPLQKAVDEMAGRRSPHLFDLRNLSSDETGDLVSRRFCPRMSGEFTQWLFNTTRGNPLFISEVLNVLLRRNIIQHRPGEKRWEVKADYRDFPLSPTIESTIRLRLRNLTEAELSLLQAASVLGEEFESTVLGRLVRVRPREKLLRVLHRLEAQRLVEETGPNRWRFSHPLIRESLYKHQDEEAQRTLHRRAALLLKSCRGLRIEETVRHLIVNLKPAEESPSLCTYLMEAGLALVHRYNEDLSWQCLTIAKRIAARQRGRLRQERLRIDAELVHLSWVMGKNPPPSAQIQKLIPRLTRSGLRSEALRLYRILLYRAINSLDMDAAETYLKKGLAMAHQSDEDFWVLRAEDCNLKGRQGRFQEAEEEAQKLIEEIDPKTAPAALWKVLYILGMISFSKGNLKAAHRLVSRSLNVALQFGLTTARSTSEANLGLLEIQLGQLQSASAKLRDVVRQAELAQRAQKVAAYEILLGRCLLSEGEYENAMSHFDAAMAKAREIGFTRAVAASHLGRSEALLEMERHDEALSELEPIPVDRLSSEWLCDLHLLKSRVLLRKGELAGSMQEADAALELSSELSLSNQVANALGQKAVLASQEGKRKDALGLYRNAKRILEENEALPDLSRLETEFGLSLGGERGERIFAEGLKILFKIGATPKVEHLLKKMEQRQFSDALASTLRRLKKSATRQSRLEVRTFGGLSVTRPGDVQPITQSEWQSRKARELFALILVLSGRAQSTREILASYLWPEASDQKSQANFRVTLTRLNRTLNFPCIEQDVQFLSLNREWVWVDFWRFEELLKQWLTQKREKPHLAEKTAQEAMSLYRGDFLPEMYEPPINDKQMELKEKAKKLLTWLTERHCERFEWQEAILLAYRLLAIDSVDERAHRVIMEGLWRQGDRTGALRQFGRLKTGLKQELGLSPSRETVTLQTRIIEEKE